MHNRHHIPTIVLTTLFYHSHQIYSRRTAYEQSFVLNQVVCHVKCLLVAHLFSIINGGCAKISSGAVKPDTFNNGIKRIFNSITFFFLWSEEHIKLDFIKKARTFRIGKNDFNILIFFFQVLGNPSQCSSSACWTDKAVYQSFSLFINLRSRGSIVHLCVLHILKLVGKVSLFVNSVLISQVEKMVLIYDGNRWNLYYLRL